MILDGKKVAEEIKQNLKTKIEKLTIKPSLAIVTFGEDEASKVYVKNKIKAAIEVGIEAAHYIFTYDKYNSRYFWDSWWEICGNFNGVIIQLPAPSWVDVDTLLAGLPPQKDVDGLTISNIGYLNKESYPITSTYLKPCTPKGIIALLDYYFTYSDLKGKNALVIGRSNLVGKPIAKMLLDNDMTVTICHSKTPKDELLRAFSNADLVVSAAGQRNIISEEDAHYPIADFNFKQNRIIIDVGINKDEKGKLCGDFSEEFKQKYSEHYTPVPGGVGPMTVAILMANVYQATQYQ